MQSPRTGLCADLTDKTTLPSNRALPPGGLIRGCVLGKHDFVSEAKGVLTLLPSALAPLSDKQLPLSLGAKQKAAPKDPLAETPHMKMS